MSQDEELFRPFLLSGDAFDTPVGRDFNNEIELYQLYMRSS